MKIAGIAIVAGIFIVAARADISGTVTLSEKVSINLDTGQTGAGGGDLALAGTNLTPQGKATAAIFPSVTGEGAFDNLSETVIGPLKFLATAAPLPTSRMPVGTILVVFTNGSNPAKLLVTANRSIEITFKYVTYIAAVPTGPTITGVFNNSSHIGPGLPNSGIAPSSIFIITGSGLAYPGDIVLQSSAPPGLPLTLNGASLSVTVGGSTVRPAIYYTSPKQIAAVLPAATRVGSGTVTVTYNGVTSAAFPIVVVSAALGFNTYNGFGVATDAVTGSLISYNNAASPGQALVLWTTGLGADPLDSDTTYSTSPQAVAAPLRLYIGGVEATIVYQGSAGYPGVDQINIVVPANASEGCFVSMVAVMGTQLDHSVILPIRKGGGPCLDVTTGLTGDQISPAAGSSLRAGSLAVVSTNSPNNSGGRNIENSATAAFASYRGLYPTNNLVSPGGCIIYDFTPVIPASVTILDPGAVTLTGPNGLNITLGTLAGVKTAVLSSTAIPASGGTFTFKGSGSNTIGPFTATVDLSSPLTWTNPQAAATVIKPQGLTVTWTGGNPGTFVYISGGVTVPTRGGGPTTILMSAYKCMAPVEARQFTVPPYILSALLEGNGTTSLQNVFFNPFSVSGVDVTVAGASVFYSVSSTYRTAAPAK